MPPIPLSRWSKIFSNIQPISNLTLQISFFPVLARRFNAGSNFLKPQCILHLMLSSANFMHILYTWSYKKFAIRNTMTMHCNTISWMEKKKKTHIFQSLKIWKCSWTASGPGIIAQGASCSSRSDLQALIDGENQRLLQIMFWQHVLDRRLR